MLKEIKVIYLGDLYRFYYEESGEIALVLFYSMMGTNEKALDPEDVPREALENFEAQYML